MRERKEENETKEEGMKLKTVGEWIDIMDNHMAGLEQAQHQSIKHKVCIECFSKENLVLNDKKALIKSTDYYMCKKCKDWWNKKNN